MPLKISKAVIDAHIREKIFDALNISSVEGFKPINARQWGCLVVDDEGHQRYARVGVIVAEMRDDMTAAELMQSEVDKYEAAQEKKRQQAAERKIKAERDKAKREAAAKEKEGD